MDQSPKFDKLSFIKYMKNIGRAYRNQATVLVSICRKFVQAQAQTPGSGAELRSALELVDDALKSAVEAEKKTTKLVDEKFEKAINALSRYEMDYHSRDPLSDDHRAKTIRERMATAKEKDKSSSNTLNAMKEKLRMTPIPDGWSKPTEVVKFLMFKSLPDDAPVVVNQVLSESSNLAEVLWNFSRFKDEKRITLKQNPHFYKCLPRSKEAYGNNFRGDPVEKFLDTPRDTRTSEVYVLTDRPSRVYLEHGQNARAFGNVWLPEHAIIFKDVCGKLEGESIVGAPIQGNPNLRYSVEAQNSAATWEPLQDWREPIRRALDPQNTSNIHISTEPPKSPKCLQGSPCTSSNSSLGSSKATKQTSPSSTLSPSAHTQPVPVVTTGIALSHGISQSASLAQLSPTSPPPMVPTTPAGAPREQQTPQNITQRREETPNIPQKLDLKGSASLLSANPISLSGKTSCYNSPAGGRDTQSVGNAPGQANVANSKMEGAATMANKPNTTPLSSQGNLPHQRQWWFQGYTTIWKR